MSDEQKPAEKQTASAAPAKKSAAASKRGASESKTAPAKKSAPAPEKKGGAAKPPVKKDETKGNGGGKGVAWLALLLALGLAGGGYYYGQRLYTTQQQLLSSAAERQQLINSLQQADQSQRQLLAEKERAGRAAREALQQELNNALQRLQDELGRDRNGWLRYEVEFLLGYANQRLQLARDIGAADAALAAADQRLQAAADPALLPVREVIASERQALAAVPKADVEGMVLELAALGNGIEKLPLPGAPIAAEEAAGNAAASPIDWRDWRALAGAIWSDIKGLVVVRTGRDQPLPLTSPEQRFFLQQNLRLQLLAARVALLQGEQQAYVTTLNEAEGWLGEYFDHESSAVEAARATLKRLAKAELRPTLPDISGSLHTLRKLEEAQP